MGLVKLIEWPLTDQNAVFGIYDHRANKEAEWVAIIDIDEYIFPGKSSADLHNVLKETKKQKIESFKVR